MANDPSARPLLIREESNSTGANQEGPSNPPETLIKRGRLIENITTRENTESSPSEKTGGRRPNSLPRIPPGLNPPNDPELLARLSNPEWLQPDWMTSAGVYPEKDMLRYAHRSQAPGAHEDVMGLPPAIHLKRYDIPCVPPPPLLDPNGTAEQRAEEVLAVYCAVVKERYGRIWPAAKALMTKHADLIHAAAQAMLEHEVPPWLWVTWKCDQWEGKKSGPPIAVLLGPNQIGQQRGWFRKETEDFGRGIPIPSASFQELCTRNRKLRFYVQSSWPMTIDQRYDLALISFPDGLFERLLAQARVEWAKAAERLVWQARRGKDIWSPSKAKKAL